MSTLRSNSGFKNLQKFYMSQMNPREFVHNTAYSVRSTTLHSWSVPLTIVNDALSNFHNFF